MIVVFVFTVSGQKAKKEGGEIHEQVKPFANAAKYKIKLALHQAAEHIQRIHIEKKVGIIGVYKPTGKKTVKLVLIGDGGGIKYQVIKNFIVAECGDGNDAGDNNNNNCN